MREVTIGHQPVLVLREAKPPKPVSHRCAVDHGELGAKKNIGAIIQCTCGRRYKCRVNWLNDDYGTWVRRILPWPPKQAWPLSEPMETS